MLDEIAEVFVKMNELEKEFGIDMPLILHGGESLNYLKNTNMFDILLLNCKRVGHGINLFHHS